MRSHQAIVVADSFFFTYFRTINPLAATAHYLESQQIFHDFLLLMFLHNHTSLGSPAYQQYQTRKARALETDLQEQVMVASCTICRDEHRAVRVRKSSHEVKDHV